MLVNLTVIPNEMLWAFALVGVIDVHTRPTILTWLLRAGVSLLTRGTRKSRGALTDDFFKQM